MYPSSSALQTLFRVRHSNMVLYFGQILGRVVQITFGFAGRIINVSVVRRTLGTALSVMFSKRGTATTSILGVLCNFTFAIGRRSLNVVPNRVLDVFQSKLFKLSLYGTIVVGNSTIGSIQLVVTIGSVRIVRSRDLARRVQRIGAVGFGIHGRQAAMFVGLTVNVNRFRLPFASINDGRLGMLNTRVLYSTIRRPNNYILFGFVGLTPELFISTMPETGIMYQRPGTSVDISNSILFSLIVQLQYQTMTSIVKGSARLLQDTFRPLRVAFYRFARTKWYRHGPHAILQFRSFFAKVYPVVRVAPLQVSNQTRRQGVNRLSSSALRDLGFTYYVAVFLDGNIATIRCRAGDLTIVNRVIVRRFCMVSFLVSRFIRPLSNGFISLLRVYRYNAPPVVLIS